METEKVFVFYPTTLPETFRFNKRWIVDHVQRHVKHERAHARIHRAFGQFSVTFYYIALGDLEGITMAGNLPTSNQSFIGKVAMGLLDLGFDLINRFPFSIYKVPSILETFIYSLFATPPRDEKEIMRYLNEEFAEEMSRFFDGNPYHTKSFKVVE